MHSFFYNGKSRFRLLSFQRKNSEASWEITLLSRTFRQLSENDRLLILLFLVFTYSLLSLYHIYYFCQELRFDYFLFSLLFIQINTNIATKTAIPISTHTPFPDQYLRQTRYDNHFQSTYL